jgi:PAS domain S-box-containing protein
VRDRAFPIRDDAGTVYRIAGIAADVTELKSAEETLRESEQRFRSAFDHASTGMALCALDGRWLKVNRSLCNIVGYNEQELLATDFQSITYPDDLAADMEGMRQLLAGESQSYQLEKRYFHKQGHIVWILLSGSLVRDAWGEPLYFIAQMQDITERKRLEKQILEISDREQQRIGQDLHDGLCQHLTGTALATKVLEDKLAAQLVAEAAEAREIAALINEAISQARSISRGLYPVGLEAEGLMAALQEMAAGVEEVWRIPCVVECNPPVLVHDHAVALQLYRIAQEAVNNALKHAQARQIVVHLCVENGRITLSVQDDGVGIPRNLRSKKGMGLHIMAYRARVIAASFEVSAGPDGGTTVTCRLPQQKSAAQRPES